MRMYDERNKKRQITCGYCYNTGHNKRNCPHLKEHFLANKNWDLIDTSDVVGITAEHFPPRYQSTTVYRAIWHFRSHFMYAKGLYGDEATSTPRRPRKKTRCGFCGSRAHTRRNCKAMKRFVKDLEQTNKAFRSEVYDKLFQKMGFGLGAFVEQSEQDWYGDTTPAGNGLVTSLNIGSVSIGNIVSAHSDYSSTFEFEVDGSKQYSHRWHRGFFSKELSETHDLPPQYCYGGYGQVITKVIAPAPSNPSKEWFLGQSPAFDWVVKKKSLRDLWDTYDVIIKKYHPDGENVYKKWDKKCR